MRNQVVVGSVFLGLCGCGGGDEGMSQTASGGTSGSTMGSGGSLKDDPQQPGGSSSEGSGGQPAVNPGGGGMTSTGTGGDGSEPDVSTAPFVFVGTTEGMIRVYRMSKSDGSLSEAGSHDAGELNFLSVGPESDGAATLFVSAPDQVKALEYSPATQAFVTIDTANLSGRGTHIASTRDGSAVFSAHYGQNAISFFGHESVSGFSSEEVFYPGEKAHQIAVRGDDVYVPCLGSNHVAHYRLATDLVTATPASAPAAGGPRHMDFHPSESLAYVLSELSSQIHVYDIAANGGLTQRASASVFAHSDEQGHWSSDIKVSPRGNALYAVNRDPSEIVTFSIDENGGLSRGASIALNGEVRSFGMAPSGDFLQVGSKAGILQTFSIDADSGVLSALGSLSGQGTINVTVVRDLQDP